MPAIVTRNLMAKYDDTEILHDVSMEVEQGEIMVIMGQSGCGKTTLLRHLIGLQKPASGEVLVDERDLNAMSKAEYVDFCRSMGVLFQSGALFNSLTVGQNVAFPLKEHSQLDDRVIDIAVDMKLTQVDLPGTQDKLPSQLSGGMRKRAALARALALDPSFLFLDEPTTGLDPIIASGIDDLILKLRDVYGATIVVVSHDIHTGMRIGDKILLLKDGNVVAKGTPDEVKSSDHPYVTKFLGRRVTS